MAMFWIFLSLVVVIVLGNALVLLRTGAPRGSEKKADQE
jgi:hypothetical protein